jgi:peptidyl-prolyl cis-trans isomerase A (cyclophilin A)
MSIKISLHLLLVLSLLGLALPVSAQKYVCMEMNVGDICMELHPEAAPITVANFLKYVNDGDYNQTMIHRSVPGFVIQGGGFYGGADTLGLPVPKDPTIRNEFALSNLRGTVAMAKLGTDPNSATSQWFVNLANNSSNLDFANGGFTVFATVVKGMDVMDKIAAFRRVDLDGDRGSTFDTVPVNISITATSYNLEDLVHVNRAYATETIPARVLAYQCSASSPTDTLTEFCGTYLTFPVDVNGQLLEATMTLSASMPSLIFNVDLSTLKAIVDTGQARASYNPTSRVLTLPSVRAGARAFVNVQLLLTNASTLEFTLKSFAPR